MNIINGATVSATDVRKSWTKIVKGVRENRKPAFVFTNNTPEAVVLSFEDYQEIEQRLKEAELKEAQAELAETYLSFLAKQDRKLPLMRVAEDGVFYQVKDQTEDREKD